MIQIAFGGRSFPALGINALDASGSRQHAVAGVADNFDQKPRNGFGIGRRQVHGHLTGNAAAVIRPPGWPGKMFSRGLALDVKELRVVLATALVLVFPAFGKSSASHSSHSSSSFEQVLEVW